MPRQSNATMPQRLGYSHTGRTTMLEIKSVRMEVSADANIIVGQAHFIKTVEDLYEAVDYHCAAGQVWLGIQRKLRSLLDAVRRKRPNTSGHGYTQCPSVGLRSHVCPDAPECLSHKFVKRDSQRARGLFHILCYRQPSRNHRC